MKGAISVILSFLLLPGSVIALLAANFGALRGYLIGAIAFFGFLAMLAIIWTFGLPGTPALTGPTGPAPHFVEFTKDSPEVARFPEVSQFNGEAGSSVQIERHAERVGDVVRPPKRHQRYLGLVPVDVGDRVEVISVERLTLYVDRVPQPGPSSE